MSVREHGVSKPSTPKPSPVGRFAGDYDDLDDDDLDDDDLDDDDLDDDDLDDDDLDDDDLDDDDLEALRDALVEATYPYELRAIAWDVVAALEWPIAISDVCAVIVALERAGALSTHSPGRSRPVVDVQVP
jgi:hypothetical protein